MKLKILFSNPKQFKLHNVLIRWFDRADYGHVAIEIVDTRTRQDMVYEISYGEGHWIDRAHWDERNNLVKEYTLDIGEFEYKEIVKLCNLSTQKGYGYLGVLGIAIRYVFGINRNIFADDDKTLICSEFVAIILWSIGILYCDNFELMTPRYIDEKLGEIDAM